MYEKIAGLNNLSRWVWSTFCIVALCLIATFLLSACEDGPQPTATAPVPTSALTPTITPAPASTLGAAIGPTVPTLSGELRSTKERATPSPKHAELAHLASRNSVFAIEMYKSLAAEEGNLFFSPYSISLALAMTYAGARGETERQMADTLRFLLPQDRLHPAFNNLDLQLASRQGGTEGRDEAGFRLNIVNAFWGQKDYEFLEAFLDVLAESYGAGVRPLPFVNAPEESRLTINDWVADQTEDRIKDLIPPGPPEIINTSTRLVLTNAIYFNAQWLHTFDESSTRMRPFHLLDGGEVQVPMMSETEWFGYARGEGYQAVDLPYHGGELSMTILLPDEGRFREFEGSVDPALVGRILDDIEEQNVLLTMPKFEFESKFRLDETLKRMGMPDAFDGGNADFSGMNGQSCPGGGCLVIAAVIHKAFVSVDEEGTEAAAATAVIGDLVGGRPEPIRVTVNRPFIFLIRDRATNTILFLGRMEVATEHPPASAPSPASPAQTALPVNGTWFLDSVDGRSAVEGYVVTLKVSKDSLSGYDGCNRYNGESEDGTPILDVNGVFSLSSLGWTDRDCHGSVGDQAEAYRSALRQGERYRVVGDRLKIFDSEDATRLIFVRQEPLPGRPIDLVGTAWLLPMEADTESDVRGPTMVFLNDRLVAGMTPCSAYFATYMKSEDSVRFPRKGILGSHESCSDESKKLERQYLSALSWEWEYSVYEEEDSSHLGIRTRIGDILTLESLPPTVGDIAEAEWTLMTLGEFLPPDNYRKNTPVVQGTEVTISFDGDGISGTSGCNSYEGLVSIEGTSITMDVKSLVHTEKACQGPDGLMEQEERYFDLLPRLTRYGMYGDFLLLQADDDMFLLFQAKRFQ